MELLHKHAVKSNPKSLKGEPPDVKILCSLWYELLVWDEILYRTGKERTDEWRLVILWETNKQRYCPWYMIGRWQGIQACLQWNSPSVHACFYWPCMRKEVENWVTCSRLCSIAKRGPRWQQAPLQQEINSALFDHVAFDVLGPLPIMVNGNRLILMMIDYFSKRAEAYALPNHKAETVADCIVNHWIAHHGIPIRIHSDNSPKFRGHVITQLKKMLSIKGTFTMPYRPQSYGLCECII